MTPFIINQLFESNKGLNFRIVTNIAVGRGINGVSYRTFMGRCYSLKHNIYGHDKMEYVYDVETTKIVNIDLHNNVLHIHHTDTEDWLSKGNVKSVYIDLNTIIAIEFFETNIGEWKKTTFVPRKLNDKLEW